MPEFEVVTHLTCAPERAFELSLTVQAHTASMSNSGEQVVAHPGGVTSGVMAAGDEVTWRARHFGVRFTMTSRITAYETPHRFVDEQVRGPFGSWWHEHLFEPDGAGTRMVDRVLFTSPFGPVGRVVDALVLGRHMERLIRERNAWLAAEVEGR